jgi:hypothetical protein
MIQHKPEAPYGQIDSSRELFDSRRVERQLATGAPQLKTGLLSPKPGAHEWLQQLPEAFDRGVPE